MGKRTLIRLLPAVLLLGSLRAQVSPEPEIRGTVIERGPETGLAGVEVVLSEFVAANDTLEPRTFGKVLTDARGSFSFKPQHLGDFKIEYSKPDYRKAEDSLAQGRPFSSF